METQPTVWQQANTNTVKPRQNASPLRQSVIQSLEESMVR
jgi:hypothetical protein